jgi:hypothetical protein
MKAIVNNRVYDPNDEPIIFILSQADKDNIANMSEDARFYSCYPDDIGEEAKQVFDNIVKAADEMLD